MKVYSGSEIRNVAVVGHNDTGKTTLVAQLLFDAGVTTRLGSIAEGTTTTDFDPDEIDRKHSISAAVAFAEWKNTKINLIDSPGFGIFLMEAKSALRVADAAIVVARRSPTRSPAASHSSASSAARSRATLPTGTRPAITKSASASFRFSRVSSRWPSPS